MPKLTQAQLSAFLSAKEEKKCRVCKRRPHLPGCLHCGPCVDALGRGVILDPGEDTVTAAHNRPTSGVKPKQGELF